MMKRFLTSLLIVLQMSFLPLLAQEGRPVTSTVQLHVGSASVRDTYLAPLLYTGADYGIGYDRMRSWRFPAWTSLQTLTGRFTSGEDRGAHSEHWAGRMAYRYAAMRSWNLPIGEGLTLMAGPYLGAEVGFNYNLKMAAGNNPATARLALNTGLSLMGRCPYRLWSRRGVVSLLLQAPLMGYTFMPEYGASYYESFYLENTRHLHHFTSLHNQQDLDLRLTTDFPVLSHRGGAIRLGLGYHVETMKINQISTRFSAVEAIVGWTFQSVPARSVKF